MEGRGARQAGVAACEPLGTYGAAGAPEALDQPGQNARNADDPPEPSARDACDFAGSPASVAADVASAANAVDVAARRAVDLYSDLILRLSYTYLKSTHDAEDICQTILMKLLMRPGGFENVEHEKAWVVRATANACKDILRSGFRRRSVKLDAAAEIAAPEPEESAVLDEVMALPVGYRECVYLHYFEGYSISEIADMTNRSVDAVSKCLSRGRSKLRIMLKGGLHEQGV